MSLDSNRYGEQSHPTFRNQRLYYVNGQWYFDTREGNQVGPHRDKNKAKQALAVFIAKCLHHEKANRPEDLSVQYGTQDGIDFMLEELSNYFSYRDRQGENAALLWAANRIKNIINNEKDSSHSKERADVIQYAMDHE